MSRTVLAACLALAMSPTAFGFQVLNSGIGLRATGRSAVSSLREGVRFAAARKQSGVFMQAAEEAKTTKKSPEEILSSIKAPLDEVIGESAEKVYDTLESLKEKGVLSKWNSAALRSRPVSQNELKRALKTEKTLDELLGLAGTPTDLKQLTVAAFAASAVFGVGGSIIGGETGGFVYWMTYLGGSLPLVLIAVGSVAPGAIGDLISKIQWKFDETNTKERRIRHEAAHLMCGYLCGLPIEGYELEPTPVCYFYDRRDGNIADIEAWKKPRPFSVDEVNALSVTSLSGLMGELTAYDKADGGQGDLELLQTVFLRAEEERMRKPNVREDQTRWGALQALQLLETEQEALSRVCEAMGRDAGVQECIAAIEAAPTAATGTNKDW